MQHITVGRKYGEGKVAKIECVRNDRFQNIDIKDKCFLLIILNAGKLEFKVENEQLYAAAPAFICFDETADPVLISKQKAQYTCIYFHPEFLNVNMSFEMLRKKDYGDIASTHDLFLLKPFTDKAYVVPIAEAQLEKITQAAGYMQEELQNQRDMVLVLPRALVFYGNNYCIRAYVRADWVRCNSPKIGQYAYYKKRKAARRGAVY